MRFWDASAVVPLLVSEKQSRDCQRFLAEDPEVVVWCLTAVEVVSALTRRLRENSLKMSDFRKANERLSMLERAWSEVISLETVRERARRLLEIYPLRAADALQLAAALIATEERPAGLTFVSLDQRLGSAAEKEGFTLLGLW